MKSSAQEVTMLHNLIAVAKDYWACFKSLWFVQKIVESFKTFSSTQFFLIFSKSNKFPLYIFFEYVGYIQRLVYPRQFSLIIDQSILSYKGLQND